MIQRYKRTLINCFNILQKIKKDPEKSNEMCYTLQIIILRKIMYIEKRINKIRNEIKIFKGFFKTESLRREETMKLTQKIHTSEETVFEYKRIIHILKSISDGVAFVFIDKYNIKPLVFKQSCGFVSGKKGLKHEVQILKQIYKKGLIAILNDITNCLRYGDITIPVAGHPYFLESKTKKAFSKRNQRQEESIKRISEYLKNDISNDLPGYGKYEIHRVEISCPEVNCYEKLNELLKKAYSNGNVIEKIEKGLYYYIGIEDPKEDEQFQKVVSGEIGTPLVFFVNNFKYESLGYYPFTLSIEDPEILFDFYNGEFVILVIVDFSVVSEMFMENGFEVEIKGDFSLFIKKNGVDCLMIFNHYFKRVASEFLSLDWIIKEACNRFPLND
jgi:hypothetical protein